MRLVTSIVFAFLLPVVMGSKCGVNPQPTPVEPKDTAYCPAACDKLRVLGCEEGNNLPDGTTCETFCLDTQKSGHALRPSCVMDIQTCADIVKCSAPTREINE